MPSTMVRTQSRPSEVLARDIVRYSDAELDQYLEANGRLVQVTDWENLPEDFIQRLRARAGPGAADQSRPIDPDDLTARLEAIPSPTPVYDEAEMYQFDLNEQTIHYNNLLDEGGRPSHPVSLGRDVEENPGEYKEILSYWQNFNYSRWKVFETQMDNWRHFCRWQRKNREEGRFQKYLQGVRDGLAEHGFTRPFHLDEDPERQDKLTTWVEYLDFEYWWYDDDMRFVKRYQPWYEKAWKKVVDSKVLKDSETEEFILNIKSSIQHGNEELQAETEVESAEMTLISAQKATTDQSGSGPSPQETQKNLALAQDRLDVAIESLKFIKNRNKLTSEFIANTRDYRTTKRLVEDRRKLLRWIAQQFPLIEIEMNQQKMAEKNSSIETHQRSDHNEGRVSKRQILDRDSIQNLDRTAHGSDAEDHDRPGNRSCDDQVDGERPSRRSKNSHDQSTLENSQDAESTLNEKPYSKQHAINQGLRSPAVRSTGARSNQPLARTKKISVAKTVAKRPTGKKQPVLKRTKGSGKLSTVSSHPLRRSTRIRKPPVRFQ